MRTAHCHVEVRVINPASRGDEIRRKFETWFVLDGSDLVFRSQLRNSVDPNEQLKWLHRMLRSERKFVRRLQGQGLEIVIRIYCDRTPITIQPESLLLAHQLHLPIEIVLRKS